MKLPLRKWQIHLLTVDREGIVLQRQRMWKYWTLRFARQDMRNIHEKVRWGYDGYRPMVMVAKIR